MEKREFRYVDTARAAAKPAGGFVFITGTAILSAWWAYRSGIVSLLDLRVWLAASELVARRCVAQKGRLPRFSITEVKALVGSKSDSSVRRSIGALVRAGLLTWSETCVTIGPGLQDLADDDRIGLDALLEEVPNHGRRVPVPRRIVRMLARDGTRAVIATVFAHLLRCLYYRNRHCRPTGTCKASWIADAFGVDIRNVKAARKALAGHGILRMEHCSQWFLNRHGSLVTVNLAWNGGTLACLRSPPPRSEICRDLPPPYIEPELLRKIKNQKPPPAVAGLCRLNRKGAPPSLRHVVPSDLADTERLKLLYQQACEAGYVNGGEADRLKFFAAAEHARAVATRNPAGLFATTVRQRRWSYLTLADEDTARRKLTLTQPGAPNGSPRRVSGSPVLVSSLISGVMTGLRTAAAAGLGCQR